MKKCLVCANPDLNLIDGSSIWAQTIALGLAETKQLSVDFLAKSAPKRKELFAPLQSHNNIRVINGGDKRFWGGKKAGRLQSQQLFQVSQLLDLEEDYDIIVVRGYDIAQAFSAHHNLLSKCWIYLTDIPQHNDFVSKEDRAILAHIADGAMRILYQSEGFADLWRSISSQANRKLSLYSPVIPDISRNLKSIDQRPSISIYAGKFRSDWKTLEMAQYWPEVNRLVPDAELVMIGDLIHADQGDTDYRQCMVNSLKTTPNLRWLGALSREEVQENLVHARVGLSWRSAAMDGTLECSTKILEYGGAGCAAILNRNKLHESLLGEDYPLFANAPDEFVKQLSVALADPEVSQLAADRLRSIAENHTFSNRVVTLTSWLKEDFRMKKTVLLAGHDFKFFHLLQKKLEATGRYKFLIDKWQGHKKHDEMQSQRLLKKAHIIFCEWCLGNLQWYSENKLPGQQLVARFHLQEKNLPYLGESDLTAIDHISYVSEQIRREANEVVKVDESKTSVIPNLMDDSKFTARKKMGDARFTLGIIGISPKRKRLDLALDTLELLLEKDSRYVLRIKGTHPFDYPWLKNRPEELEFFMETMKRINSSDSLRYNVIFDPAGDDVDQWLTMVGFILSPSDFESFHLAVGEGMLTGSLPVVWNWAGALENWPKKAIVESPAEAAERINLFIRNDDWVTESQEMRQWILESYSVKGIVDTWEKVLLS